MDRQKSNNKLWLSVFDESDQLDRTEQEDRFREELRNNFNTSAPLLSRAVPSSSGGLIYADSSTICTQCGDQRSTLRKSEETLRTLRRENFNLKLRLQSMEETFERYKQPNVANDPQELLRKLFQTETNNEMLRISLNDKQALLNESAQSIANFEKSQQKLVAEIAALQRNRSSLELQTRLQILEQNLKDFQDQMTQCGETIAKLDEVIKVYIGQLNEPKPKKRNCTNAESENEVGDTKAREDEMRNQPEALPQIERITLTGATNKSRINKKKPDAVTACVTFDSSLVMPQRCYFCFTPVKSPEQREVPSESPMELLSDKRACGDSVDKFDWDNIVKISATAEADEKNGEFISFGLSCAFRPEDSNADADDTAVARLRCSASFQAISSTTDSIETSSLFNEEERHD